MSRTERAFLRHPPAPGSSRPRFETGPRPRHAIAAFEVAERERVARLIREPRLRKGMPQSEAAKALGVTQAALSAWERAKMPVPAVMRLRIAELYGFDPVHLQGLDAANVAVTADERVMLNRFRLATDAERRAALAELCP